MFYEVLSGQTVLYQSYGFLQYSVIQGFHLLWMWLWCPTVCPRPFVSANHSCALSLLWPYCVAGMPCDFLFTVFQLLGGQKVRAWSCKCVTVVFFRGCAGQWEMLKFWLWVCAPSHPRSVSRSCRGFAELAKMRRDAGTEINCRPSRTPTHTHILSSSDLQVSCEDKILQCWIRKTVKWWTFQKLTCCRYILCKLLFGFWLPALHIRDLLQFVCSKKN